MQDNSFYCVLVLRAVIPFRFVVSFLSIGHEWRWKEKSFFFYSVCCQYINNNLSLLASVAWSLGRSNKFCEPRPAAAHVVPPTQLYRRAPMILIYMYELKLPTKLYDTAISYKGEWVRERDDNINNTFYFFLHVTPSHAHRCSLYYNGGRSTKIAVIRCLLWGFLVLFLYLRYSLSLSLSRPALATGLPTSE